ncbi:MAG TPA: hypothetical protein GXZ55_07075 [Natronincola sp.]|nr:hypothetical protein [Natronincola sp.]
MAKKLFYTLLALLTISLSITFFSVVGVKASNVEIDNDYIRIVVNNSEENRGRFSVGTTGGDPDRDTDQNKHLIYGGDDPWTSYTTVRVGNLNWVYGSPTDRRAGYDGLYGEMVQEPTVENGTIQSSWKLGPIQVWQILSLSRSTTTGLLDTARIEYHVKNNDSLAHMVGLRLMLDTMLGSNDGAPFRVEDKGLVSDSVYYSENMPEFWQAFDSLTNPRVMSQGTLKGPDTTTPDRVYFTNWGSVADSPWNFDFTPGRDFTRIGEYELDSAISMFWDPKPLGPGETRNYVSYYGLGGVTIAPGELVLGVTSPAQITSDPDKDDSFSVIAYVQNDGKGMARGVEAKINLPDGLELVNSPAQIKLSDLDVQETTQTSWQVRAKNAKDGVLTFEVEVTSINSEPNKARRQINVLSPAKVNYMFSGPPELRIRDEKYNPSTFEAKAVVRNDGGTASYGNSFEILIPYGLELVQGQSATKFTGTIEPGEEVAFSWLLKPKIGASGTLAYSLKTGNSSQSGRNCFIIVPELKPKVWVGAPVKGGSNQIREGDYFSVSVWATNIPDFFGADLDLNFDSDYLEVVGKTLDISRGSLFIDDLSREVVWKMPSVYNSTGELIGLKGDRGPNNSLNLAYGTLVTIHFYAKKAGDPEIKIKDAKLYTSDGVHYSTDIKVEHQKFRIEQAR